MSDWISVGDKLPETGSRNLVLANDIVSEWVDIAKAYVCPEYGNLVWEDADEEDYVPIVTHWMPLPTTETK